MPRDMLLKRDAHMPRIVWALAIVSPRVTKRLSAATGLRIAAAMIVEYPKHQPI